MDWMLNILRKVYTKPFKISKGGGGINSCGAVFHTWFTTGVSVPKQEINTKKSGSLTRTHLYPTENSKMYKTRMTAKCPPPPNLPIVRLNNTATGNNYIHLC